MAYLETCAVDCRGLVDNRRMRCNPRLHREFAQTNQYGHLADGSRFPTRTRTGEVQRHDDWSCLEDLVATGRYGWRLENVCRMVSPVPARGALGLWEWEPPDDWLTRLQSVTSSLRQ